MKKLLIYLSAVLFLYSCAGSKKAGSSAGAEGKSQEFVDLYFNQDVVEEKIPLAALQHAQYRLSKKLVYTSSGWVKGAYTDESGSIVLPDKSKLYQLIYDENLPGLYDLDANKNSTSKQSFFVNYGTDIKGPALKMVSNGGLYYPPKTFQWQGRTWTANDIEGANLMVRFKPDVQDDIVPIKLDGRVLGGGGESSKDEGSGGENYGQESIESTPKQSGDYDSLPSQQNTQTQPPPKQQAPASSGKKKFGPR